MKGHPDLQKASTQQGFADLVGCSKSLIKAVEQGQTKMTDKLLSKVQAATGVPRVWLATKQDPAGSIPSLDGDVLTHGVVIRRFEEETQRNLEDAKTLLLIGSKTSMAALELTKQPSNVIIRRVAASLARIVEEALLSSFEKGDTRLMMEITRLLAERNWDFNLAESLERTDSIHSHRSSVLDK